MHIVQSKEASLSYPVTDREQLLKNRLEMPGIIIEQCERACEILRRRGYKSDEVEIAKLRKAAAAKIAQYIIDWADEDAT